MPPKEIDVELTVPTADLPSPEAVNWFHFTYSGPEIEMMAGFVDLHMVHLQTQRMKAGGVVRLKPEVSHRFVLSYRGFALLRSQVEEIARKMEAQMGVRLGTADTQAREGV